MDNKNYFGYEILINQEVGLKCYAPSAEAVAIHHMELESLRKAREKLNHGERELLDALFFNGISERAYMQDNGLTEEQLDEALNKVYGKLRAAVRNIWFLFWGW